MDRRFYRPEYPSLSRPQYPPYYQNNRPQNYNNSFGSNRSRPPIFPGNNPRFSPYANTFHTADYDYHPPTPQYKKKFKGKKGKDEDRIGKKSRYFNQVQKLEVSSTEVSEESAKKPTTNIKTKEGEKHTNNDNCTLPLSNYVPINVQTKKEKANYTNFVQIKDEKNDQKVETVISGPLTMDFIPIKMNKASKSLVQGLATPVESNIAQRMMAKMGWTGGGLGSKEDGITEPIAPNLNMPKQAGFGHKSTKVTKTVSNPTKVTPVEKKIKVIQPPKNIATAYLRQKSIAEKKVKESKAKEKSGVVVTVDPKLLIIREDLFKWQPQRQYNVNEISSSEKYLKWHQKGCTKLFKKKRKHNLIEVEKRKNFYSSVLDILLNFVQDETKSKLIFDCKLTKKERKNVHHVLQCLRKEEEFEMDEVYEEVYDIMDLIEEVNTYVMYTESMGDPPFRYLHVYKEAPEHVYLVTKDDLNDSGPSLKEVQENDSSHVIDLCDDEDSDGNSSQDDVKIVTENQTSSAIEVSSTEGNTEAVKIETNVTIDQIDSGVKSTDLNAETSAQKCIGNEEHKNEIDRDNVSKEILEQIVSQKVYSMDTNGDLSICNVKNELDEITESHLEHKVNHNAHENTTIKKELVQEINFDSATSDEKIHAADLKTSEEIAVDSLKTGTANEANKDITAKLTASQDVKEIKTSETNNTANTESELTDFEKMLASTVLPTVVSNMYTNLYNEKLTKKEKLHKYFEEFIDSDEFTEFRFLGDFDDEEKSLINELLRNIEACVNDQNNSNKLFTFDIFSNGRLKLDVEKNIYGTELVTKTIISE